MYRIGHGFDVHPLVKGKKLILGGVTVKYEMGLDGHSDADVLIHAVIDSILGATAQRDIGFHFPDTDPEYKNISSRKLLKFVFELMTKNGFRIVNLDATIHAEKPKLAEYINEMRNNLAEDLDTDVERVNVKATTWEKLGYVGEGRGIACDAVVLVVRMDDKEPDDKELGKISKKQTLLFEKDVKVERRVKTKGEMTIYTDGASHGNPGPSGAGAVIQDNSGKTVQEIAEFLGQLTNNQAEYQALILALKEVAAYRPESLLIRMDSELIVKQLIGQYKVKDSKLIPLHAIVTQQLNLFKEWHAEHIPREKNKRADALATKGANKGK